MNRSRSTGLIAGSVGIFICLFLFLGSCGWYVYKNTNKHDVTVTVKTKERVNDSNGNGSKYLVYAEDKVYQVTDNLLTWDFNSSDRYNELEEGKTYNCDAVGFRFGLFSWYENLLDCEEVTP